MDQQKNMFNRKIRLLYLITFAFLIAGFAGNAGPRHNKRKKTKLQWGYGASVIYNFQATGWGGALRVKIPITEKLSAVPEFNYFPAFNDYHEYYAGAALHYELFTLRTYNFYPLVAAWYNNWINADDYAPGQRKQKNFAPEAGAGLVRNRGCLRPFIEDRYDFKWKENNLRIGIYWYPNGCKKGGRKENCPAVGT